MTRQVITERDFTYTISFDDSVAPGHRMNALVQARLIDELTGAAITTGITVTPTGTAFDRPVSRLNVSSRIAAGGLVGLTGVPATVFPRLASQPYEVGLSIRAAGYAPRQVVHTLGAQPNFPSTFALAALGDVVLHRLPVIVRGRTVRRTTNGLVPVANATVRVTGIWRTLPGPNVVVPAGTPNLVSVTPSLYHARPSTTGVVRTVTIAPAAVSDKQLIAPALAGTRRVALSNREGISVGDVLGIASGDLERQEHIVVAGIEGASSPSQPATIELSHPLAVSHARDTIARVMTTSSLGPQRPLSTEAIAGDTTLFCTSIAGFDTPKFVEISGGGGEKEYHWLRPYVVTSDANGDYVLPPVSRIALLNIEAQHAPDTPVLHTIGPLYPAREQYVDFTFV